MKSIHLNRLDLNLLKVFDALIETGSTVRAADRLGLTQSAVSHALSRLRHVFAHDLFIREHGRLTATPFALETAPRIRDLLLEASQIVDAARQFDPATSRRTFTIAMPDYALLTVLPGLRNALAGSGPGLGLEIRQTDSRQVLGMLDRGIVSMAVGNIPLPPSDIEIVRLFDEHLVCAATRDHPIWQDRLTLASYLAHDHLDVVRTPGEPGLTDTALAVHGAARSIKLRIATFLAVPQLVASSGLIATEPARVLGPLSETLGYRTEPLPFDSPHFTISLARHRRVAGDSGYDWLKGQIVSLFLSETS